MPYVGQLVGPQADPKQTWLLDNVVVRGFAQQQTYDTNGNFTGWASVGSDVSAYDWFFLLPDENYQHLTAMFPGNRLFYAGCIYLETYPIPSVEINNGLSWWLPAYWLPAGTSFSYGPANTPGTGTIQSIGVEITGTGTMFDYELQVGWSISAAGQTRAVASIYSPTSLRTDEPFVTSTQFNTELHVGVSISAAGQTTTVTAIHSPTSLTTDAPFIWTQKPGPTDTNSPYNSIFQVIDPLTGSARNLQVGDHIEVRGRWTIDHHPEKFPDRTTYGPGVPPMWAYGYAHTELHPFDWMNIK